MTREPALWTRLSSPYLLLLLPPLFWATNAIVGKVAAQAGIPPAAFAFWRWVLALILILPFAAPLMWQARQRIREAWPLLLLFGALSAGAYNVLMYAALQTSTALNVTLVAASMPVVMAVLARVWLTERLGALAWVGIAVSGLGVLLVIARGDPKVLLSLQLQPGDLLMLLATLSWSIYSVLLRRHPPRLPPLAFLAAQMAGGLVILLPLYAWESLALGQTLPLTATTAWILPYTAVFPAILAFYFWNKGVAAVGPGVAGVYTNLLPLLTALMAVVLLGEALTWVHVAGLVLILGGIALVTHGKSRAEIKARAAAAAPRDPA